jgi:hypothetical protein
MKVTLNPGVDPELAEVRALGDHRGSRGLARHRPTVHPGGLRHHATAGRETTVDQILTNQIGELWFPAVATVHPELSCDIDLGPGLKWGSVCC